MSNNDEVVSRQGKGNGKNGQNKRNPGITPIEFWEGGFPGNSYSNDIEKILEMPGIEDPAGIFARGIYRNEEQRVALIELWDLAEKHHLERKKTLIRNNVASTIGWKGFGKVLQLSVGTQIAMPGVTREILEMKKSKEKETDQRRSDFRSDGMVRDINHD